MHSLKQFLIDLPTVNMLFCRFLQITCRVLETQKKLVPVLRVCKPQQQQQHLPKPVETGECRMPLLSKVTLTNNDYYY